MKVIANGNMIYDLSKVGTEKTCSSEAVIAVVTHGDAEAIAQAINFHDDLLAVLEEFKEDVEAACGTPKDDMDLDDLDWPDLAITYNKVCAILGKLPSKA